MEVLPDQLVKVSDEGVRERHCERHHPRDDYDDSSVTSGEAGPHGEDDDEETIPSDDGEEEHASLDG